MICFTMRLAGMNIRAGVNYERTKEYCSDFFTDGKPDFEVAVSDGDIELERDGEDKQYSEWYLETLALYRKIAERAAGYGAILFHSSAVAVDGKAYVFTAKSGTGKSTHVALWKKLLGERATVINDDKPLIRQSGGKFTVHGTPWNGKHKIGANISAELAGICIISRGEQNEIRKVSPDEALPTILSQTFRPSGEKATAGVVGVTTEMAESVPIYKLKCNMDISAAETSYGAMKGK